METPRTDLPCEVPLEPFGGYTAALIHNIHNEDWCGALTLIKNYADWRVRRYLGGTGAGPFLSARSFPATSGLDRSAAWLRSFFRVFRVPLVLLFRYYTLLPDDDSDYSQNLEETPLRFRRESWEPLCSHSPLKELFEAAWSYQNKI